MKHAILYRHWLDMRVALAAGVVVVVLLSMFNFAAFSLVPMMWAGDERVVSGVDHAWSSGAAALFLGLILGGTGVRTGFAPGHPSLHYTLTLPASRLALLWTRLAAGGAATVALLAVMLIVNGVGLLVTGHGVPPGTMAGSSFLAGLLAVAIQAVVGLLLPLWDERLKQWAIVAVVTAVILSVGNVVNDNTAALSYGWAPAAIAFLGSPPATWSVAVPVLAVIVAASLFLAGRVVRSKDF